jgi:hypothetical protein
MSGGLTVTLQNVTKFIVITINVNLKSGQGHAWGDQRPRELHHTLPHDVAEARPGCHFRYSAGRAL